MLNRFIGVALLFLFSCVMADSQAIDWPTLGFTQVVTNTFNHPVSITHAGDGSQRMFIVEQPGCVWIMQSNSVLAQPFLTITDRVNSAGVEQGLLGLAFPPGFSTNRHFYVDYTRQPDGAIVISRFFLTPANSNIADIDSEQPVIVIPKPSPVTTYNNHNAGQLAFGPDGYLYIGVGDGGSEADPLNNGQNTTNLFGKILRIDVESGASPYAIPANNPYVSSNGYAPETWAYGLRNPWRFSFDDLTGDLYIGDVGQNNYEEIDFQPAGSAGGQNYGWRIMEGYSNYDVPPGFTNFSALTLPVAAYPHSLVPADGSAAVIGGYVYRGPSQPRMDGMYFFGDYVAGWIWGLKQEGTNWQNQILANPVGPGKFLISTFGEDDQHNLYLADYRGLIYQVRDSLETWTPTFSPTGGVINSNTVIVSCLTTNAQIHYTTNGVNPTLSDPVIAPGGALTVVPGITYKAWAYRPDLTPSGVASAVYTSFQVATPVFSPPGPITNGTTISISCATPGAVIYYTLDGTTPTTASPSYTGPFSINTGTTVEAFAVETNYANSSVESTNFQLIQTAIPAFYPPAGPLTFGTHISILCSTPESTIYYSLDGSTPTTNSLFYSGPITFQTNFVLNAFGFKNGYANSPTATGKFTWAQLDSPAFKPRVGPITNGTFVALSCSTPNSTIYYTLDGSTPTTNSLIYSGPFRINGLTTVAAFATANLYVSSGVSSVAYGLRSWENTVVTTLTNEVSGPLGLCLDQNGNLYVANDSSGEISKISPSGQSTNIALFSGPSAICIDSAGNLFVADSTNEIWKIQPDGITIALAELVGNSDVDQLAVDSGGNIYAGLYASVQKVRPAGTVVPFANVSGWSGLVGVGIDAATNIYAANSDGVWRIAQNGTAVLYAGGNFGYGDGPALSASFQRPYNVAVDASTNIYVTDNYAIRKISPTGFVSTMAGSTTAGYQDGPGSIALFDFPFGICVDTNGNILVADAENNCIREISPDTYGIGIADWWQLKYFGRIGIDPNSHPSNNGMTAYEDFWAGLIPTNPASVFKIESATVSAAGTQISWDSVFGKNYTVQWSPNLISWNTLASSNSGTGSIISYTDSTPLAETGKRFYRILVSY